MPASAPGVLLPPTTVSANGAGDAVYGLARYAGVVGTLNVSAAPAGGAPTLDVYVQATSDDGVTWRDVAAYRFTGVGKRIFQLSQIASPGTTTLTPSDGALASDASVQGPFGDRLRVKYAFAAGGSTGSFALAASFVGVGGP